MNSNDAKLAILMGKGLWDHLDSFSNKAISDNPCSPTALAAKGLVALRSDDVRTAESYFLDALQIDSGDPLPKCGLLLCYYRNVDFTNAERCLLELLAEYPESEGVHVSGCWLYVKFRKWKLAEQAIDSGLRLFPDNEEILNAQLYYARNVSRDDTVTQNLCESLLKLNPNNLLAHLTRGEYCLMQNEFSEAEQHFRTCMTMAPSDATARLLQLSEAKKTGKGSLSLLLWTIKRKLMKLFLPGHFRKQHMNIKWGR